MKKFEVKEFSNKFFELGVKKGDVLLVHSSLLNFGTPTDCKISKVPSQLFSDLRDTIGDEGNIAVPTFNFDFCKGLAFNRQETPSKNMGVFSEFVRKLPIAQRSHHPMQSIAVVGRQSGYIIENDTESAFSPEGPFDRLKELEGKILLLGADFNSVSIIHLIEEKYNVPYRYWKTFSGTYTDNNDTYNKSYKTFVRSLENNPILKMYSIERELKRIKKLQEAPIGGGVIKIFDIKDFLMIAENYIQQNPYFFISNHQNYEIRY